MFCAFLLILFFPAVFFHQGKMPAVNAALGVVGIAFILLGQIIRVSSRGYKSEHSHNGNALIQGGPYALVRNPMYLGILFIGFGIVAMLFKWWVAGIFLAVFIIRYILLIFKEEEKLKAAFPREYPEYRKRVPRLLPSLPVLLQKDIRAILPLKLSWVRKEIGSILAVLILVLLAASWQEIKSRGLCHYRLIYLPGYLFK